MVFDAERAEGGSAFSDDFDGFGDGLGSGIDESAEGVLGRSAVRVPPARG